MPNDCNCEMIFCTDYCLAHIPTSFLIVFNCVVMIVFCLIVPVLEHVNKLVYSTRAHQNTWGECHRHRKGIQKRDDEVWTLHNIQDFWCRCWWMCRQTMAVPLHMHSGCPTKRLEQMIATSLYDITRVSHARGGGNYKRRA